MWKNMAERFLFFWHSDSPFSQWHSSPFVASGMFGADTTVKPFINAEQWMMYNKALLFGDVTCAELILKTRLPRDMKQLGRKVKNFNEHVWKMNRENIVLQGNRYKFDQHPALMKQLLDTRGLTLVEASPHDTIWGIGLRDDDPRAQQRATWNGSNLLGHALTQLRDQLTGPNKSVW
jgi:ribA/ribD-fused uncharacterized protein